MVVKKQYYFLAGFFRSGNTLLSALLNQHPLIYSSPISPIVEYIYNLHTTRLTWQASLSSSSPHRSINLISKILDSYYYDIDKQIIIDRDKNWANPYNMEMIMHYIQNEPKFIFTTRPLLEAVASYIQIAPDLLYNEMKYSNYQINTNISTEDNICEYLLTHSKDVSRLMEVFNSIDNPKTKHLVHIVKYDDLLSYSQDTMNNIYDFLNVEHFKNDFNNIFKIEDDNDEAVGLPKNLHLIRPILKKNNRDIEEIFSPYIIEKYKDARYF